MAAQTIQPNLTKDKEYCDEQLLETEIDESTLEENQITNNMEENQITNNMEENQITNNNLEENQITNNNMEENQITNNNMEPKQVTTISNTNNTSEECDCDEYECPGCFFPCKTCKSTKCGHICRTQRFFKRYHKWEIKYARFQKPERKPKTLDDSMTD